MVRQAAVNEFKTLVVDLRRQPVDHGQITDVFLFFEGGRQFPMLYQCKASNSFGTCNRVPVSEGPACSRYFVSGTQLSSATMRSGIGCVQSFVLQSNFVPSV